MSARTRTILVVALAIMLALGLAACGGATPTAAPTVKPGEPTKAAPTAAPTVAPTPKPVSLRVAILTDESTLQPYTYVKGYPGWNMMTLVYDTLYIMDADQIPRPWLATADKVSADGKVHTITLRGDAKWHDGKALTSADVKFSFEFYKKNTHSRWTPPVKNFVSIDTPNDTTVVITLPAPDPSFAVRLLGDVPIIPKHLWETVTDPKKFENNIGSGPYKLTEYKAEQFYRFTANAAHFAGKPAVDELIMPIIKDPTTIFSALKTGEIQSTIYALSPELVKDFQSAAGLKVVQGPGYATTLLQFNDERAPWSTKEVRQAINLAIDTKKLVDTVLLGFGVVGNPGWIHPASPFHDPAIKGEYNVDKAKALLDSIGYKDTNSDGVRESGASKLEGTLLVYSNNPTRVRTAELIAAGLKDIGINLKVSALESASVDAKVWPDFDVAKGRDFDLAIFGWSAPIQVNPVRTAELVHSDPSIGSINIGAYKNPATDKVAAELIVTVDPDKQKALVRQLEAIIAQDLPFSMLYYADGIYAYRPDAYDKWSYQKGQGPFHKLSFLPNVKF
jgi:peptide/nickel transport system substrate-binding protein